MEKTFGELVRFCRINGNNGIGWTAKQFIQELGVNVSAPYLTKIEQHGEIPSVDLIKKITEICGYDNELKFVFLEKAKEQKLQEYEKWLNKKYGLE